MLRPLAFLAAACLLPLSANAQPAPSQAPPPAAGPAVPSVCENIKLGTKLTTDISFLKACQETLSLQAEVARKEAEIAQIKSSQSNGLIAGLISLGPLFGALVALISAGVGYAMKSNTERRLMLVQQEHERAIRRENRTMQMLGELSGAEAARQSFAAAGLLFLVREVMEDARMSATDRMREASMLITALFARLRDPDLKPAEVKYIADGLYRIFLGDSKKKPFRLADFNLQQVRLSKAYLKDIDAQGADFFEADLSGASLRSAQLQGAIFRNANLNGSVFAGADVDGADLRGADLRGAMLADARNVEKARFNAETRWDKATTWPQGFNPSAQGLGAAA